MDIKYGFCVAVTALTILSGTGVRTAAAEEFYRGLLMANAGAVLDLRPQRFNFAGGGLSFNKVLANLLIVNPATECALRLNTEDAIPNVGDHSAVERLPNTYTATYDAGVGGLPAGHVSLTTTAVNPAQNFSDQLHMASRNDPNAFNDNFIVSVAGTIVADEACRDKIKQFE